MESDVRFPVCSMPPTKEALLSLGRTPWAFQGSALHPIPYSLVPLMLSRPAPFASAPVYHALRKTLQPTPLSYSYLTRRHPIMAGLFQHLFPSRVTVIPSRPYHSHFWRPEALNYPYGPREFLPTSVGGPKRDLSFMLNPPTDTVGLSPSHYAPFPWGRRLWELQNLRSFNDKTKPFDDEDIAPGVPVSRNKGSDDDSTTPLAWRLQMIAFKAMYKQQQEAMRREQQTGFLSGFGTATGGGFHPGTAYGTGALFGTGPSTGILASAPGTGRQSEEPALRARKMVEGLHPSKLARLQAQGSIPSASAPPSAPASTLPSGFQQLSGPSVLPSALSVPPTVYGQPGFPSGHQSALPGLHPGWAGQQSANGAPTAPSFLQSGLPGQQSGLPTLPSALHSVHSALPGSQFGTATPSTFAPFGAGTVASLPSAFLPQPTSAHFTIGQQPFNVPSAFSPSAGIANPSFQPSVGGFPSMTSFSQLNPAFPSQFPTSVATR